MITVPTRRPRRTRQSAAFRRLVSETRLHPEQLVLPVFVKEGITQAQPIASLPGVQQIPLSDIAVVVNSAVDAGLGGIMLFGVPRHRDGIGSGATNPDGILNQAIRLATQAARDRIVIQADLCLDEFTDHGHCGIVDARGAVDNDATLERYAAMALAQAEAGVHLVGLSGMMDGQVAVVRGELDRHGFTDVGILAYSAKYASALYGPFRDAVESTLEGDRKTYQMDPANGREGLEEARLDIAEGADFVMVKPAGSSLDIIQRIAAFSSVPVWAYQVSGEYALIEAGAAAGLIARRAAILESVLAIRRAGADVILTYWALELAHWLQSGEPA